jgi:tRNA threonylcarbamoyladenosine biosynthesis protein TsaB
VILLGIDTSTEMLVLGLRHGTTLSDATELAGREQGQRILPAIVSLLEKAGVAMNDLDGIVFGQGPGSFTGLRIGVGVVQGLAYGLRIPVAPVSTLAILAQAEYRKSGATNIVVALHARKDEVFFGTYEIANGLAKLVGKEAVHTAADVPPSVFDQCVGIGSGWQFEAALTSALGVTVTGVRLDMMPTAEDLLVLGMDAFARGRTISALEAQPEYLREQVASLPGQGRL